MLRFLSCFFVTLFCPDFLSSSDKKWRTDYSHPADLAPHLLRRLGITLTPAEHPAADAPREGPRRAAGGLKGKINRKYFI